MLKNKIAYALLFLFGVYFVIVYDEYISLLIFCGIIFVPILSWVLLQFMAFSLSLEIENKEEIIKKGTQTEIMLHLKNHSFLPIAKAEIYLQYKNYFAAGITKEKISVFVDSKKTQSVQCRLLAPHCGQIEVSCKKVVVYDYFRIFCRKKKTNALMAVMVLPDVHPMHVALEQKEWMDEIENPEYSQDKPGDDPSEVFQVRPYRQGDKQHRIHWKLSSKRKQFMVKEFSLPIAGTSAVLLDFFQPMRTVSVYDMMDELYEIVFSLSYALLEKQEEHKIVWFDSEEGEIQDIMIREENDLYSVAEQWARIKPYAEQNEFIRRIGMEKGITSAKSLYYVGMGSVQNFQEYALLPQKVELDIMKN